MEVEKDVIVEQPVEKHKAKRKRKRLKGNFNAIRAQMEFYFGDANLSKDRFLKKLIDTDPFVPLEIFLTFNKMKTLTSSVEEIAKSLTNSELLEVDETQQKVRRKTALPHVRNVDEKTLYVECLPPNANHDWVKQVFELFGPVVYVSLPKYSKSRKIKEFGFVEFEKEKSVEKAVKAFQEFDGVLSMDTTKLEELKSIKTFIKEQNNEESADESTESKVATKRPKPLKEETDADEPKPKKNKLTDEDTTSTADDTANPSETETETGAGTATEDENKSSENKPTTDESATKKKLRHRKKRKKSKSIEKRKMSSGSSLEATIYDLKILPKRDWKRLRNKYLNLQRAKMAEVKLKNRNQKKQPQQHGVDNTVEDPETLTPTPAKKSQPNDSKLHKMNMNFYGAGDDDSQNKTNAKEAKQNPALEGTPLFNYAPGLIIEVGFLEPCVNVKEFKAEMRQYASVKYVDVKEGAMHAYLRCESAQAAEEVVQRIACAEYRCTILTGEGEGEYWKKIEQDRENKLKKLVKIPVKRGREKVKKLVSKHMRFGDEE